MTNPLKLAKLIVKIQHFAARLEQEKDFTIHRHINQFYYMQKVTELSVLSDQYDEAEKRLSFLATCLDKEYSCVFAQWKQDMRWLQSHYITQRKSGN